MKTVYLALGSNLGQRKTYLDQAVQLLDADSHIKVDTKSALYETEPVGEIPQGDYLNAVIKIYTDYTPLELLDKIHDIEKRLDRKREIRWGPRTLDIDILWFADLTFSSDRLTIPHKEMKNRGFVLIPLADVAPDNLLRENSLQELMKQTNDYKSVRKLKGICLGKGK